MKMKIINHICASLLFIGSISSQRQFDSTQDVSRAINSFTNTLLNELELSSTSNFVFSPFSVHSVLSQVLFGAEGNTRSQLQSLLGLSPSDNVVSQYQSLATSLRSGSAQLAISNELALAKGFKPKPTYTRKLGDTYSIKEYDFANDKANAVNQINNAVSQKTGGLIKDLLLEEDVDPLTRLLLINAIYFKAQWKTAFNPQDTFYDTFLSPQAGAVNTSFMTMNTKARIMTENGLDILELPYADETMSMIIVLPTSSETVDISEKIGNLDISAMKNLTPIDAAVTIPKFKMKYQTYLKQKLTKLGVTDLFTTSANLRGISDEPLYASEAVHQASIEVNEEGSEAAAATAVVVGVRTIQRRQQFFANRPFLFMIYDFQNNIPLFAGKVVDPTNTIIVQKPLPKSFEDNSVIDQSSQPLESNIVSSSNGEPDTTVCPRLLRDFPNALDNHKICQKVLENGQYLDWLRDNRNLCEQSADHYTQFTGANCGPMFCDQNRGSVVQWRLDYQSQCKDVNTNNQQDCKNLENKLKAYNSLSC